MTISSALPLITNFSSLDLTTQTFTRVGSDIGESGTLIVGGKQRASIQNCLLAVGYKSYMANEAAIASQLTQIQLQNQDAKLASAIMADINALKPEAVVMNAAGAAISASRIFRAAYDSMPASSRGAESLDVNGLIVCDNVSNLLEKLTGTRITDSVVIWYTEAEIDAFINKIAQYQQNATTQNTVLQEQLVIYNNHRQTIMSFMTSILTAFDKATKSLIRSL